MVRDWAWCIVTKTFEEMDNAPMSDDEAQALFSRAKAVGWAALTPEEQAKLRAYDDWEFRLRDFCGPAFLTEIPGFAG